MKEAKVGASGRLLLDPEDIKEFIEKESAEVVAKQLQADSKVAVETLGKRLPSLVALYMPSFSSTRAREVAALMWPNVDITARHLLYEETLKKIKRGIDKPLPTPAYEDGHDLSSLEIKDSITATQKKKIVRRERQAALGEKPCYICRMEISTPHPVFKSFCQTCGDFNMAGSRLSLPDKLNLDGKVALVTGARINLGFHTARRLLRCGARVIVTTRYPRDALERYRTEPDFDTWSDRLRVVGADFRAARDAFELVRVVKDIVEEWGGKLYILINNAAQTLTDSVEKEQHAIRREALLLEQGGENLGRFIPGGDYYHARVRGGSAGALEDITSGTIEPATPEGKGSSETGAVTSTSGTPGLDLTSPPAPSSWVQSLTEIPYEDIITAHSVNTFVSLILIRELLALMANNTWEPAGTWDRPASGFIVNVSSREGIFERSPQSSAKSGKHVHTNMSKAGLNMITETEESTTFREHRVAMNTVDPGYMSAAPEFEHAYGGERPIGWEDGAGRVLWPIALSQSKRGRGYHTTTKPIWGRFLKHYGTVRVDTSLGRG
jgi:NAD(P)-dependent dehydrogenase (short-subunit alcohol dehydrogenase family)